MELTTLGLELEHVTRYLRLQQVSCEGLFDYEIRRQPAEPGVRRRIAAAGTAIMGMLVEFEAGAEGAVHAHPHEQLTYVAKGELVLRIGDSERQVSAGDTVYIPSDTPHGVRAVTPARCSTVSL
ncbi:cupin domain-containing protein [Cohnella thailandensis]|uniref:Cupin domain-containing protein n=1 Tax=Cohnella thailandensis TaxID=557557 RepID=A0A841SP24_9BACL|nr:cupin domain-containing protein [Cohnella thailandensis]MBB6634193.1 cupin domain-containing protein [Cohnella thailandensis]MBP1972309.1 quercetin dioxygenase-like cupin family protein [Cohnella thailandensis]